MLTRSKEVQARGDGFGDEIRFDESRPAINNLLEIYHLITGKSTQEVEDHFAGKGYAQLKGDWQTRRSSFCVRFSSVREITDERLDAIWTRDVTKPSRLQAKLSIGRFNWPA